MRAASLSVLRSVCRPSSRRACRFVAGSRHPISRRNFHRSAISYQLPRNPPHTTDEETPENVEISARNEETAAFPRESEPLGEERQPNQSETIVSTATSAEGEDANRAEEGEVVEDAEPNKPISRAKRIPSRRIVKPQQGLPPVVLPPWFLERNVRCFYESDIVGNLAVDSPQDVDLDAIDVPDSKDEAGAVSKLNRSCKVSQKIEDCGLPSTKDAKYTLNVDVYLEILAAVRAGLTLRPNPSYADKKHIPRPVTVLQCPKDGGTYFLDSILETIATKVEADLVSIDAQDIAQIVGPYLDENHAWAPSATALLGYAVHKLAGKLEAYDQGSNNEPEEQENVGDEDESPRPTRPPNTSLRRFTRPMLSAAIIKSFTGALGFGDVSPTYLEFKPQWLDRMPQFKGLSPDANSQNAFQYASPKPGVGQWTDLKAAAVLEALVGSADAKRTAYQETPSWRPLIIQVRDYKEISSIPNGAELLNRLRNVVDKRWSEGRDVIIVGTTSTEEMSSTLSTTEIQHAQVDIIEGQRRTIIVPPNRRDDQLNTFESDESARIRRVNVRHIEDMIRQLADRQQENSIDIDIERTLDNATAVSAGLEDVVLMYATVYRLATTILGLEKPLAVIDGHTLSKAMTTLNASDEAKFAWSSKELKEDEINEDAYSKSENEAASSQPISSKVNSAKLKKIKKNATSHEAKLLSGVIMPADIKTTFSNIRAPKETVEALKTLTSLSLIRPEAFSYGVLATDKIPGLLLYGPPGTGKTLLAKAVAKESGATVLEVSGADVNDMYVGESEKNVKAIFSLAKKLSPCVVFIDEADAIFAARGGEARRSQVHRELINQFLREWDGMNDLSAFIMVATNRPFDLDEAVLRRLPRRLLVDLPIEKDREAILGIHLNGETLDESVSLAQLAKDTPYYSGSDLKNLSVAAAMACIREENEEAAKHVGDAHYEYPNKRILTKKHFVKAMEEISASISEDMSTLSAIRKFDEKYGDRKGRRKKAAALGFGGTMEPEKDSEAGRVRKLEA